MSISNDEELSGILKAGKMVARIRDAMRNFLKPGMTTFELDDFARKQFAIFGGVSAPKQDYNYPGYTCISLNDEAAHGLPSKDRKVNSGDLINIDVSGQLDGFYADTGISFVACSTETNKWTHLCDAAKKSTLAGIKQARTGNLLRYIGRSIHETAKNEGYTVIKNLAGHGTGRKLHEAPEVLNFENKREKKILNEGLVLAIESFVSNGSEYVYEERDGWTLKTPDGSRVAQFEHTVVVTKKGAIIATV
ncbi:type I methionyl aminopeptidase [Leptospira sp. GIMC2001]|uniref:type I methionyl aminopeptidase n=1 Tax=Leptospira sp. GIMC2001 TaxID=1513297 RepID=UPI0023499D48|nr:type I methionyl aminopeptidase [Leptospira sp. GIMC2001]WCL49363.1 type I methionyl aminopeptidase [Leptospira sp. GIMC2001]